MDLAKIMCKARELALVLFGKKCRHWIDLIIDRSEWTSPDYYHQN